jgi:ParB family transcriptional regulator, chromosome partitioning protein
MPFDKNDAALVPEAGSCAECPKRAGFSPLPFGELSQRDRCSDAVCFNNKLNRFVARQIEKKPTLVQISTAHGTRGDGAALPRSRYVALHLAQMPKSKQPLSPHQKPCKHMAEAIVVDGAERGHTVKVCAEQSCAIHFADRINGTLDLAQLAKEREQRRRGVEKRKLETTVRHRTMGRSAQEGRRTARPSRSCTGSERHARKDGTSAPRSTGAAAQDGGWFNQRSDLPAGGEGSTAALAAT